MRALQRTGHAVGYLGDGINDAPALHAADVGISVDRARWTWRARAPTSCCSSATSTCCAAASRTAARTFANTLKYISITTSANFGNMVSMALATPLLPFLPLAAKQILLNNFLSDLPSMAISTDRVDAERSQAPAALGRRRGAPLHGRVRPAQHRVRPAHLLRAAAGCSTPTRRTFQTAWFVVSLLTELAVVLVLRTHGPAWRSAPSTAAAVDARSPSRSQRF